jgi:Leucine-rich repeat (LRR) protein
MKPFLFLFIILFATGIYAQDYSYSGKSLSYSESYRKAKRFKTIDAALLKPEQVQYLDLTVDRDGLNYQKFIDNHYKFTQLKKLIIDNRWYQLNLQAVPDLTVFKELEFLQVLSMPNLNFDQLSSLSHLKYLDLDACGLKSLPASIIPLKQLECLILSVNYLTVLPDNINELTNLKEIDLTNNCFEEVPKQIAQLRELLYLDINNAEGDGQLLSGYLLCKNKLLAYPAVFSNCRKLKKVSLYKVSIDKATKHQLKAEFKTIKFTF